MDSLSPHTLYIVATPIGNLEDMTYRSLRILRSVSVIAAEDTRHTGKLLQHFQITTPQISYHEHNTQERIPQFIQRLKQGETIALVTDAGVPGISDPGLELVQACIEAGMTITPIPGACAIITALCAAGLPTDRFVFEGFLPAKAKARRDRLDTLLRETRTLIFYESPHRLRAMLTDLATSFGADRSLVLGRELTKLHEEFWRGTIAAALEHYQDQNPQGEYTIVVAGAVLEPLVWSEEALIDELKRLLAQGLSRADACRQLAATSQRSRRDLYQLSLSISLP
ncbi:MAG: 16S rRNA (cytidine(1402)-2'-O)-methyltransferase [Prochlorotrichaceae cyanobacterium]|jgi:16S rRNA (cytidine1402-2'-O)-methyltransferase